MPDAPPDVDFQAALDALRFLVRQARGRSLVVAPEVIQLGHWVRWITEQQGERGVSRSGQRPHGTTGGVCPACSQNTLDHRHTLTKPIANGLLRVFYAGGGPVRISELMTNRSMLDNFQKLRYWGLAEQAPGPDGGRTEGYWRTTGLGDQFCRAEVRVPRRVWTYQGDFLEFDDEDDLVRIDALQPGYLNRDDYADAARSH